MSTFTDAEIAFLNRGPLHGLLGRLATVGPDGTPHVTPLGVLHDPDHDALVIGGRRILPWGTDTEPFELSARDVT